jgi:hypothetical protein
MEKINLKEILEKHNLYPDSAANIFIKDGKGGSNLDRQLAALKETWNLAVDKCKENISLYFKDTIYVENSKNIGKIYNGWEGIDEDPIEVTIDENSLEQVKQLIL